MPSACADSASYLPLRAYHIRSVVFFFLSHSIHCTFVLLVGFACTRLKTPPSWVATANYFFLTTYHIRSVGFFSLSYHTLHLFFLLVGFVCMSLQTPSSCVGSANYFLLTSYHIRSFLCIASHPLTLFVLSGSVPLRVALRSLCGFCTRHPNGIARVLSLCSEYLHVLTT